MFFNEAYAGTLPLAATDVAARWDGLYEFLFWLSALLFVGVVGAMIYFAVRYRARPGQVSKYSTGSHLLEAVWITFPTALLMVIFAWGYSVYRGMTQAPSDALEIHVIAKQWLWQFQYNDGRVTVGEVFVPLNKPVKMVMTSEDVIHSFFVPNFRVKQDVVPGMYTSVWFEARVPGRHQIFCAEYCGTSHSGMLAKMVVLDDRQWKDWENGKKPSGVIDAADGAGQELTEAQKADQLKMSQASAHIETMPLADQGKQLAQAKGCVACHSADGSGVVGPTWKGLYGSDVELKDGSKVKADENYIRESITDPQAKIVKGFNPVMPTFKGLVSETEINALIAYIKSLK